MKPTDRLRIRIESRDLAHRKEYEVNHCQDMEKNRTALDAFLNAVQIFSLEPEAGEHYGQIRALLASEDQLTGDNDMWIAAHARSLGLALMTHSRSEFSRVPDLVIDSWMND